MKGLRQVLTLGWPYWALFFVFMGPLLVLQKSFLLGDYSVQHLPWAWETYRSIHSGTLPFWTNAMAGGFPLFAEGQCAALYLLNWLGYRFLPFFQAYTWSIPLHFLIGGIGMFLYVRKLGRSPEACVIAGVCFCFSSAYAGCFYNTGSLRTLCWLPLMLWILERARAADKKQAASFIALTVLVSQQWCAGFPQMAVYAFGYLALHELLASAGQREKPKAFAHFAVWAILPLALGTMLAWPQIAPTLELISQSVRQGEGVHFALWGSVPPVAPVSLLFPQWGNALRFSFYLGIFPLFLILAFFFAPRERAGMRQFWLSLFFFSLALGKFNPLYRWAIETFSLTSMRNPAKFLFFSVTALSVLSAFGFDALGKISASKKASRRFARCAAALAGMAAAGPPAMQLMHRMLSPQFAKISRWYVTKLIQEKGAAAGPAEQYSARMDDFFRSLGPLFSSTNFLNVQTLALAAASALLLALYLRKKMPKRVFSAAASCLLIWDLLVFGFNLGTGFIGNAGPLSGLSPSAEGQRVIRHVQKDPGLLVELVRAPEKELFYPNSGMLYGVRHAGGYSPLLLKGYYDLTRDLGIVDSSMGRKAPLETVWRERRGILDLIGARYIHTDFPLDWEALELLDQADGFYFYENLRSMPVLTARFPGEQEPQTVHYHLLPGSRADSLGFHVGMPADGLVTVRVAAYPGWMVKVGEKRVEWGTVNRAFLGFALTAGEHDVLIYYRPTSWPAAWIPALAGFAVTLLTALFFWRRK